jgi:hypothetical protein
MAFFSSGLPYCGAFATFREHFLSILFLYCFIIDALPLSHLIAAPNGGGVAVTSCHGKNRQ